MFCKNCGMEFEGKFCPNCGTAATDTILANTVQSTETVPSGVTPSQSENDRGQKRTKTRKKKKKKGFLIPVVIIIALLLSFSILSGNSSGSGKSSSAPSEAETDNNDDNNTDHNDSPKEPAAPVETESAVPAKTEKIVDYKVNQEYFYDYVNLLGTHTASAFVEIENTGNTNLYLSNGKFDIEDNNGHLLKSEDMISTCPDAIYPGEKGYFYEDYISLDDVDTSNGMKFVPHYKVEEAKHEIIDYETSDIGIREDAAFTCKVTGRLTNTTEEEIGITYVNAVFYDADGNVIGISGTNLTEIGAGETESFEIIGQFFRDNVSYSDIAQYRLIPRAWYMQF